MEMPEPDCTSHHERCINSLIFLLGAAQSRTLFLYVSIPLAIFGTSSNQEQLCQRNTESAGRRGGPVPAGPVCMEVSKTNPIPITATPLFNLNWAQFLLQCKTSVSGRYVHFQGIVFLLVERCASCACYLTSITSPRTSRSVHRRNMVPWVHMMTCMMFRSSRSSTDGRWHSGILRSRCRFGVPLINHHKLSQCGTKTCPVQICCVSSCALPLRQFSGFNGVMWQVGLCQRALWSQC